MSTMAERMFLSRDLITVLLCSRGVSMIHGRVFGIVDVPATPNTPALTRPRTIDDLTEVEKYDDNAKIQVNTKFVKNLQPEWSKFVTDVKLAMDMHNASFDQLYAYLRQHEVHANEVQMMRQRFPDPLTLIANTHNSLPFYNTQPQYNLSQYHPQSSAIPQQQQFYSPPLRQQSYEAPFIHQQSYQTPIIH
ncbi:hypothetical protein Tco_1114369 [Tanacetum coccineum]|uniref:Uncharacterized protein n=1 Tax=Tanacetum coccineum TaxID=301880 RepID=A0ABQ5IUW1_9ASTR